MTRTSLQRRSARGSAAETAASPPTRTKSSISVVTNKTFKANALVPAVMILMQEWVQLPYMLQRAPRAVVPERTTFPVDAAQFRVAAANQNEWPQKAEGASRNDHSRQ